MTDAVFAIPVADDDKERAGRTFKLWQALGYQTAALIDGGEAPAHCDVVIRQQYKGWAWAVNTLADALDGFDWLVTGGADIDPDPQRTAQQIAAECYDHFGGTYGVMQPVGDPYGALEIQSACVSPWLGLRWRQRHRMHEGYYHFFADTELAEVAGGLNRLWWNHDITQFHDHWMRRHQLRPGHLELAAKRHKTDRALFTLRKSLGFP
jgi:hypothetical protein